jgi:exonuclease VII small subunit
MPPTTEVEIKEPDAPITSGFAEAYAELQAIAERLKPSRDAVPNVDEIEPLVRRAQKLAAHCEGRINAVKQMLNEQTGATA